jgi:hypothetical protein
LFKMIKKNVTSPEKLITNGDLNFWVMSF